ncbi:MAG: acyltransferase family protein [Planctomycetes bacterium]|jgi:peptidoglycan/LPS O-acetylase OafA/YrhL|nr:acyltransferase family protein [Planctomycetota bacterium]
MTQTGNSLPDDRPELTRRYDVDWLRVLGMMVVFLFHCARFFDTDPWHIKSPRTSAAVSLVTLTVTIQWMMPLFFLLSGLGAYHALCRENWSRYLVLRVKRLLVPLLFGIFVFIAPWQVYLERVSHNDYSGSFWSWYPHYFDGWFGFGGNFAWMGVHLWYLEALFVFSLLTLPLFLFLQSHVGARLVAALSRLLTTRGAIFLLAVPIAVMELLANSPGLEGTPLSRRDFGGWSLLPYLAIFIVGFLLAGGQEMARTVERYRFAGLAVGLLTFIVAFVAIELWGLGDRGIVISILRGLFCWALLIAICGFGSRHLRFSNGFLKYANEAVLPFYILHQTIILTVGFHVLRLDISLWLEYLLIAAGSFVAIMALYELLIRRIGILRFFFGLKPRRRPQAVPASQPLPST